MNINIKLINGKDEIINVITECASAFHDQSCNDPVRINDFAVKFSQRACFLAAYANNNEVTGFAAFYCNDRVTQIAFISMIVVRNIYQSGGAGSSILNFIKDFSRDKGMKRIRLEVANDNDKALSFYTRRDFVFEKPAGSNSSFYVCSL